VAADLSALTEHVDRLADLVVQSVSHSTESANITLAIIATVFLPLTFIAGARCVGCVCSAGSS
jgi:Mg2+ and Co2+ transporter CorA